MYIHFFLHGKVIVRIGCPIIIYLTNGYAVSCNIKPRSQVREDEYDYAQPVDGQQKRGIEDHWRKHTLSWLEVETGKVCFTFRPVNDHTLDEDECPPVPPIIRKY
ncbi:hypothetical protein Zmor_009565 [Zophobas morio]|uniref:Uncharacterized protein n=1 Tax=Zophobas morio TaxID=2755281 RepID=A0AA38IMD6_9CUCU|nr:hypothetical protein Zmor_009565 [Zophobas morio]